jgi:NitT/TauT family transport system ATP-binding protein
VSVSLRFEHIKKIYGGVGQKEPFVAFDDISLDIAPSEFLSIVGPSGCGKSTLLRIAAGLMPASQGNVWLDDRLVVSPPAGVVYLFQQYAKSLFPWRTVLQNVMFPLEGRRGLGRDERRKRCEDYIRQVGLAGSEDKYPWQLSGGMQQRVAIARALATEPRVLLLDEPFSAVDALTRMELQSLLLDLWSRNRFTALLVTHDVEEAIFLADRIAVLGARPTTLTAVIDVELPRPRDQIETRETRRFLDLRHQLMGSLLHHTAGATDA